MNVEGGFLGFKYVQCNKNYEKDFDEDLAKKITDSLKNAYRSYDEDLNKLCLMQQKGVHPYEYVDKCQKFDET